MKKHLLFLSVFFLSFKLSFSQTNVYHPFPDSNAIWIGTSWYNVGGTGPCVVEDDYNLYISGDTTIGIYAYHKLYRNGFIHANCPPPGNYYFGQYWGAFRQDYTDKKVFLFKNGTDTLAYDFNLIVGDTLPLTCLGGFSDNHIESIDSVLIGSNYHKRFWISSGSAINYTSLIEGIGSTLGAFAALATPFEFGEDLWCMLIENQIVWTSSSGNNCGLTPTPKKNITKNQITVYPNPATNSLIIEAPQMSNIEISNSIGQIIKTISNADNSTTIDLSLLSGGVYLIKVMTKNGIETKKFIKQ